MLKLIAIFNLWLLIFSSHATPMSSFWMVANNWHNFLSLDGSDLRQTVADFGQTVLVEPWRLNSFNRHTDALVAKQSSKLDLQADAAVVLDTKNGDWLYMKEADRQMPIASITKLMSALVFLDYNPGWQAVYRVRPDDERNGGKRHLFSGDELTAKDLFYTALVASDNEAVIGLVNLSGLTEAQFVAEMNKKAGELGLEDTRFVEPTGLSSYNISTAREVARLSRQSLNNPHIAQAVAAKNYVFTTRQGKVKTVESTDEMLGQNSLPFKLLGGKTGYTGKAGYCFVGQFDSPDRDIITVVLGTEGKDDRFKETEKIINWLVNNYDWPKK